MMREDSRVDNVTSAQYISRHIPNRNLLTEGEQMETAKIFQNGRSQAVRLPKEFRFKGKEVFIKKEGEKVILSEKPDSWDDFFLSDDKVSDDFMKIREQPEIQKRSIFE